MNCEWWVVGETEGRDGEKQAKEGEKYGDKTKRGHNKEVGHIQETYYWRSCAGYLNNILLVTGMNANALQE